MPVIVDASLESEIIALLWPLRDPFEGIVSLWSERPQ